MTENERRVRDALAAMERGDLDAIAAQAHPDVEFVNPPYAIEPGTRLGVDGLRAGLGNMLETFEHLRFESLRVIDLGERIVAIGRWAGRGKGSHFQFDGQPYAFLVTLRDGQMVRYEWFADHAEALAAAGVHESPESP
jgi:ketosteroid isomerase-like protein